ncbi:MAG: hypothetical protein ABI611_00175 [Solirubrobacteraceae bacterium]
MRRVTLVTAVVFGLFVFLGISFLLARALTGQGAERERVLDVLRAEARGDAGAVLRKLPACSREPACAQVTRQRVAQLKRPGTVQILNYQPSVRVTMTRRAGTGRVAWRAGGSLPVVQCVKALREGPLTGGGVELLAISKPIGLDASCG